MIKRRKLGVFALTIALIGSVTFMTGCDHNGKQEDSKKKIESSEEPDKKEDTKYDLKETVVTIDGKAILMKEMMYYIYQSEQQGNYYDSLFASFEDANESFWDTEFEEGKSNREALKEETMSGCILYEIFQNKAKAEGYVLTEDEKESAVSDAKELYASLTEKQKSIMGLSVKDITKIQKKVLLGNKYYEKIMKGIKIDEDAVRKTVDKEAYRQYDVDYIYIPTVNYDEEYNPVSMSKKEKQEAYDKIKALLPKAIKGREFDDLIGDDEEQLESGSISFIKDDNIYGEAFEEAALELKKGEVADKVIEGDDGYYIIKMVNDNSAESYESEVENAINNAKNEAFEKQFEKIKKDHEIEINSSVWDNLTLGKITYDEEAQQNLQN
ncbi:peptidylprolyl isomerase [Velocimicrobium porci]|uniref:PpiC domain-containing protein n=1 Tax=Velocimicrobium porci TaxID=2606634 RepID=A0A6L5Y0D1_9FIRM|nr:peptidylprolyl isomerase [Velocimicrobium porci]MSS64442.1 hypothetical protein [Velocimicrobium porci]